MSGSEDGTPVDPSHHDSFHDIEGEEPNDLCILLNVALVNGGPPPDFDVPTLVRIVQERAGVSPLGVTTLGDREAILEFSRECEVFRIARMIHSRGEWEGEPAEIHCTLAAKYRLQLIYEAQQRNRDMERKMNHFRVEIDRNKTEFSARMDSLWEHYGEIAEQRAIGLEGMIQRVEQHLVVREESMQIMERALSSLREQVEQLGAAAPVPAPLNIIPKTSSQSTGAGREGSSSPKERKPPALPYFSGVTPTPREEGTFDQWHFQVQGYLTTHTERALRTALIGSVRGEARDLVESIGLGCPLQEILSRLERRYGKGRMKDRLQGEFFQIQQEKGEGVQQFAGRLEKKFKHLRDSFPDRYSEGLLKERLFNGMITALKNSLRFMYKAEAVTYEDLLEAAKEAESEFLETRRGAQLKAASMKGESQEPWEELGSQLRDLTVAIKAGNVGSRSAPASPSKRWNPPSVEAPPSRNAGNSNQNNSNSISAAFRAALADPRQCHRCRGWGHVRADCPTRLNSNRGRGEGQAPPPPETQKQASQQRDNTTTQTHY